MKTRQKQSNPAPGCAPSKHLASSDLPDNGQTVGEEALTEFARFPVPGSKEIVLYHGDCLTGMDTILEKGSVDVLVTSPPYNIGVRYGAYDDGIPRPSYLNWIADWALRVKRVLSPKGSIFLNIGSKPSDPWIPFDVAGRLRDIFVLQNVFHWVKSIYVENTSYNRARSLICRAFQAHQQQTICK